MNRIRSILLIIIIASFEMSAGAQVISEEAKRKVTVGFDVFTDIWQGKPSDMELRTINQAVNVFGLYNFPINESNASLSVGLGIDNHNMYSNSRIDNIRGDTIIFNPIEEVYQRCKINLTYASVPLELSFRTNSGFKIGAGFKIRYLISSKEKYVGDVDGYSGGRRMVKNKEISNTETWAYGVTFRAGYKSFNLFGYYQISNIFTKGRGPQMYPISVGVTFTPF